APGGQVGATRLRNKGSCRGPTSSQRRPCRLLSAFEPGHRRVFAADRNTPKVRFASDSPLEGDGFEPSVPDCQSVIAWLFRTREQICWGTEGSNPSPSSGESVANLFEREAATLACTRCATCKARYPKTSGLSSTPAVQPAWRSRAVRPASGNVHSAASW